jgi:hypothetical protein
MTTALGFLAVAVSGFLVGAGNWPYKLMRTYQFEHWMLLSTFIGAIAVPWTVILLGCPNVFACLGNIPTADLVKSNLFSIAWGTSVVLSCLCYVRIGIGLTIALLVGLGIPVGTLTTLVFKGSGLFQDAPALGSKAGLTILASVVMMIAGVVLAALAGFGRERQQKGDCPDFRVNENGTVPFAAGTQRKIAPATGGFAGGLLMMVISGLLVGSMNFAFVYSHDSILGNLSVIRPGDSISVAVTADNVKQINGVYPVDADGAVALPQLGRLRLEGGSAWHAARQIERRYASAQAVKSVRANVGTGSIPAVFAATMIPLFCGTVVACGYAVFLLFRNRSWPVFVQDRCDTMLAIIMGLTGALSFLLWGKGTLMLGAVGASIGWGISQATKVVGSAGLGYFSGEWRGVRGTPRYQMWLAVAILIVASVIMAYGKALSST